MVVEGPVLYAEGALPRSGAGRRARRLRESGLPRRIALAIPLPGAWFNGETSGRRWP